MESILRTNNIVKKYGNRTVLNNINMNTDKVQTRCDSLTCILRCLEEENIQIPYNQLDIHQK